MANALDYSLKRTMTESVTIQRRTKTAVKDEYGSEVNRDPWYDLATTICRGTTRGITEDVGWTRDTVTGRTLLYLPGDQDVTERDRVRYRGLTWEIEAVETVYAPRVALPSHKMVTIRAVT